jgi:hypothetical protein
MKRMQQMYAADISLNVKAINIFVCPLLVELDEKDELNWKLKGLVYTKALSLLLSRFT